MIKRILAAIVLTLALTSATSVAVAEVEAPECYPCPPEN